MRPQIGNEDDGDDGDDDETESMEYSAAQAAQDVEYLKITAYGNSTANLIKEKLKLTSKYRHNLLVEPGVNVVNVVKQFPYMITQPQLVINFTLSKYIFHNH